MIQISIPEPPLGSRIRNQKTQRAAGHTADNNTHHDSAKEDDCRTAHCPPVADLIAEKRLRWQ